MKFYTLFLPLILLTGCSSLPPVEQLFASLPSQQGSAADKQNEGRLMQSNGVIDIRGSADNRRLSDTSSSAFEAIDAFGSINKPAIMSSNNGSYKSMPLTKHIGDYVRNMAQDLVSNMEFVSERTPVAVTHFSLIDSDLKKTNLLGQQMAESFAHEFHKFRMPVVEFKATQFIRVTEMGDFVMSRDFLDLKNNTPIQYVLTGTMTKHQGGFIVNARMLGMQSNVVVASAQSFIPFYIVDALIPSGSSRQGEVVDGVRIIRGE
jgi:TolB-like protein